MITVARPVARSRATHCPVCMRVPSHPRCGTDSRRSRGLPNTRMPVHAHTSPNLKLELSIRVQTRHRPGAVPMPPARGKGSSSTAQDRNKGSSAGASSSGNFRKSAHKTAKVGQGAAGKHCSRAASTSADSDASDAGPSGQGAAGQKRPESSPQLILKHRMSAHLTHP